MSAAVSESLRRRWDSSVSRLVASDRLARGAPAASSPPAPALSACSALWLGRIASLHSGPGRAYHNLDHVADVLAALDSLLGGPPPVAPGDDDGRAALDLAAFFHDAVYDPRSPTNEGDSADLFDGFAADLRAASLGPDGDGGGGDAGASDMLPTVRRIILATAAHAASAAASSGDALTCAFLDADMSVLGRDPAGYDEYARQIRAEYSFVERGTYCKKRAEVLRSFLPGDGGGRHIYATPGGREMWEERARANLRREIDMLDRGMIPRVG